jgi:chromosome segregation ATPase
MHDKKSRFIYSLSLIKALLTTFLVLGSFAPAANLSSAPNVRGYYEEDSQSTAAQLRREIDSLKHQMRNHEVEIRTFEQKLANQDSSLESLHNQIQNTNQGIKENIKGNLNNFEEKNAQLDQILKDAIGDLKLLKDRLNESAKMMGRYEERIQKLEKIMEVQSQNLNNLEAAIDTVIEALEVKHFPMDSKSAPPPSSVASGSKTYKVKPGDTLEKIAKDNQTTIQALKELNQLTKDRIIVGQTLRLP